MTGDRAEMINVVASAICRWHDPNLTDRLTPEMTAKEAAYYVDALITEQHACSCPCVALGTHEYPDEYEPSETCPVHGIGAPETAFRAGGAA